MATSGWPSVGLHDPSITLHATHVRADIESLHQQIGEGAENVPSEIFLTFSFSVLELVEKVLDQPSLDDVMTLVKRIDNNTVATLDLIKQDADANKSSGTAGKSMSKGKSLDITSVIDVHAELEPKLGEVYGIRGKTDDEDENQAVTSGLNMGSSHASEDTMRHLVDEGGSIPATHALQGHLEESNNNADSHGIGACFQKNSEITDNMELSSAQNMNPQAPSDSPGEEKAIEPSYEGSLGIKSSKFDNSTHTLLAGRKSTGYTLSRHPF